MKIDKILNRVRFLIILFTLILTSKVCSGDLVISWNPNLEEDLKGYKIHYGTSSGNYNTIIDVKNVTTYTVTNFVEGNNYYFALTAYDNAGNESEYSDEVSVFIEKVDNISPKIDKLIIVDSTHINLVFNEPVEKASAENKANYQINNGITIVNAELIGENNKVQLTTTIHEEKIYTIIINNVRDRAATPNVISTNSSVQYEYIDKIKPAIMNVLAIEWRDNYSVSKFRSKRFHRAFGNNKPCRRTIYIIGE